MGSLAMLPDDLTFGYVEKPDEGNWYTIKIEFKASDYETAENIASRTLDVVCGGEIGLGLHVCNRTDWVMTFGPQREEENE